MLVISPMLIFYEHFLFIYCHNLLFVLIIYPLIRLYFYSHRVFIQPSL